MAVGLKVGIPEKIHLHKNLIADHRTSPKQKFRLLPVNTKSAMTVNGPPLGSDGVHNPACKSHSAKNFWFLHPELREKKRLKGKEVEKKQRSDQSDWEISTR
ncbi:hypothetical protein PCANC_16079 [Puccinia coronata f. sp. avenae]|uniref:Uncharacterized protein n=1 Tax=Puccinia coronata f. sp. avenae TaxID=200324 RepID=A0A2N5T4X5_9BASI|nr:hypothetical protein PCASD_15571 [Puccinia coronata f. sp. avenae]PLW34602.1 hypothetical protein PCANC_16079 [Puccinia coronata f. sp. avenae]PLW45011.1 hypothetical protein PCASD_06975 [Puccinia coronata f. sp. avenae]